MSDLLTEVRATIASTRVDPAIVERQRVRLMEHIANTQVPQAKASAGSVEWDISEPDVQRRFAGARSLATAAALLVVVVVTLFAIENGEPGQVATEPVLQDRAADESEEDVDADIMAMPPGPVFGFERPVVLIDSAFGDGEQCIAPSMRDGQLRSTFGTSAVVESQIFSPASATFGTSVFIDLGGAFHTCSGNGGAGGAISSQAIHGSPSDFPAVVVDWFGGSGDPANGTPWLVDISGLIDETVREIVISSPQPLEQSFLVDGDRFLIDAAFAEVAPAEEVMIEIRFEDDTTTEQTPLDLDGSRACDPQSQCISDWFEHTIAEATEAGTAAQVGVVSDLVLTQGEYDEAASRFLDCLPPNLSSVVAAESNQTSSVTACYREHLQFVDQARVLSNQMWITDQENFDDLLQSQFETGWPDLRPAPTPLGVVESPLEAFFWIVVDPHALSDSFELAQQESTEHINDCLASEGFTDWREWPGIAPRSVEFIDSTNLGDHLVDFGYGVAEHAFVNIEVAELLNSDWQREIVETQNERLLDEFDQAERDRLSRALSGCSSEAMELYPLPNDHLADVPEIWQLLDDVRRQTEADASVVEAKLLWSECVQEAGYPFSSREEAVEHLRTLVPSNPAEVDLGEDWMSDLEIFRGLAEDAEAQESGLVEIDLRCATSTNVDEIRREVRFEIESQLLADDRDVLDELLSRTTR